MADAILSDSICHVPESEMSLLVSLWVAEAAVKG